MTRLQSSKGRAPSKKFRGWLYASKDAFEAELVNLEKTLEQNPKWPGSQGVVTEFEAAEGALESLPPHDVLIQIDTPAFSKNKNKLFILVYKTITTIHILIILDGFVPESFFCGSCMFE